MSSPKTKPTDISVEQFLEGVSEARRAEAQRARFGRAADPVD